MNTPSLFSPRPPARKSPTLLGFSARARRALFGAVSMVSVAALASAFATNAVAMDDTARKDYQLTRVANAPARVSLRVLVLNDKQEMTKSVMDRLDKDGTPYTVIDLTDANHTKITPSLLAEFDGTTITGKYAGIIMPNDAPPGVSPEELKTINEYSRAFKVRQILCYTWAHPEVGLNYTSDGGFAGDMDGRVANLKKNEPKAAVFNYLKGKITFEDMLPEVGESYGYVATPKENNPFGGTFTPILTTPIPGSNVEGSLIGIYEKDGLEQMVITFAANADQQHWNVLAHGVSTWLTRGIGASFERHYLSIHVDDILMSSWMWNPEGNCTYNIDCDPVKYPPTSPKAKARMKAEDVEYVLDWQKKHRGTLAEMVFNSRGTEEFMETNASDPLKDALLKAGDQLRWANHTWSHPYLGCVQNFTTAPWTCEKDAGGNIKWATYDVVREQLKRNVDWAKANKIPNFDPRELVTGEHSGVKALPNEPIDNPNLVKAVSDLGILNVASDASKEPLSRSFTTDSVTEPRHPMNIFYNASTKEQMVDEFNWRQASKADGGSGDCEKFGWACIKPLDVKTGFDSYILPYESRIVFRHIVGNDPRSHYAHQANLTDDRTLLGVFDKALKDYTETFAENTPWLNPSMSAIGFVMQQWQAWKAGQSSINVTVNGDTVDLANTSDSTIVMPFTAPTGTNILYPDNSTTPLGVTYAGKNSGWLATPPRASGALKLPSAAGFSTTVTWEGSTTVPPTSKPTTTSKPSPTTTAPKPTTTTPPKPTTSTWEPTTTTAPKPTTSTWEPTTTTAPKPTTSSARPTSARPTSTAPRPTSSTWSPTAPATTRPRPTDAPAPTSSTWYPTSTQTSGRPTRTTVPPTNVPTRTTWTEGANDRRLRFDLRANVTTWDEFYRRPSTVVVRDASITPGSAGKCSHDPAEEAEALREIQADLARRGTTRHEPVRHTTPPPAPPAWLRPQSLVHAPRR